jgi:RNA polymerase sigma-70 factor (ECF subfamily)
MLSHDTSDTQLYDVWCSGDDRAGNVLARRYIPALNRFFQRKVHDRETTADLVQRTLEKLVKSQHNLLDPTRFRSFLFGIAWNVLKNHYGEHSRDRLLFPGDEQLDFACITYDELGVPLPSECWSHDDRLVHALHLLPIESQQMLMLHFQERMKYDEIAEVFEIPPGTVASRMSVARKQLQQAMKTLEHVDEAPTSTCGSFSAWAGEVRVGIDQAALASVIPRRLGQGWRLVQYTGDREVIHGRYRRRLLRPVVELEVRATPRERSGTAFDTVSIRNREWVRYRDHDRKEFVLRHLAGSREFRLTHRPATGWDSLVELVGKLDLDKLVNAGF